jgi:hypothetical protein
MLYNNCASEDVYHREQKGVYVLGSDTHHRFSAKLLPNKLLSDVSE